MMAQYSVYMLVANSLCLRFMLLVSSPAMFCASQTWAQSEDPVAKKIVACVGDSNTQRGYPAILEKQLGPEWKAVNCGIGAATVLDGTLRPFHKMPHYQEALESEADVIIIMLGTNDANPRWWDAERETDFKGPPQEEFKARYLALIDALQETPKKPEVIVAIPLPVFPERAKPANRENTQGRRDNLVTKVIPIIKKVAEEKELPLVDLQEVMVDTEEMATDGVHFNNAGYSRMTRAMAEAVQAVAKK